MSNSIHGDGAPQQHKVISINSKQDIANLKGSKNFEQLNSLFSTLNQNGDDVLDAGEGSIYYFDDGSITVTKDGKTVAGATQSGTQFTVRYEGEKSVYEFGTGETTTKKGEEPVSATSAQGNEYVYNSDSKKFTYKEHTVNGKQYILSSNNKKLAMREADGSLRTSFQLGDSFEGTLIRLGLDPANPEIRQAMEDANPKAAKRGYFTLDDNGDNGTQVSIPTSVLAKYDANFNGPTLKFVPKTEQDN